MAVEVPGYSDLVAVGRGAHSTVYRARQTAYSKDVALKILHLHVRDEAGWRSFRNEVVLTGPIAEHPHVVEVLDAGTVGDGRPYLAMGYLSGGSLRDAVRAQGHLDPEEVVRIGIKLAGALATAHAAGVLHQDVKPANVLLSRYGEPVLGDWGVARLVTDPRFDGTADALTPAHVAPELLEDRPPTPGSDVYALASTLYHLVAGHAPFEEGPDDPVPALIMRKLAGTPRDLPVRVPHALQQPLLDVLTATPADRPTALALGERLVAAGERMGMHPPPVPHDVTRAALGPPRAAPTAGPARVGAPVPTPGPTDDEVSATRLWGPTPTPPEPTSDDRRRRWWPVAVGAASVAAMVVTGVVVLSADGGVADPPPVVAMGSLVDLPEPPVDGPLPDCPARAAVPDIPTEGRAALPPPARVDLVRDGDDVTVSWEDTSGGTANFVAVVRCDGTDSVGTPVGFASRLYAAGADPGLQFRAVPADPVCVAVGYYLTELDADVVLAAFSQPVWHCDPPADQPESTP